jgi:hypothetical protein
MRWTVRLEARTDQGEVKTTELATIERPVVDGTFADLGLALAEAKAVLAKLQRIMILLAKSAGRLRSDQSGKVRTPGASRGVSEDPVNQAHKVHGGGRGDMLQVCLDLPEVAGSA